MIQPSPIAMTDFARASLRQLLAPSNVMGTGWFAVDAANVKPGAPAVVVGDGAVGLLDVLSAKLLGAERIIAASATRRDGVLLHLVGKGRSKHWLSCP